MRNVIASRRISVKPSSSLIQFARDYCVLTRPSILKNEALFFHNFLSLSECKALEW